MVVTGLEDGENLKIVYMFTGTGSAPRGLADHKLYQFCKVQSLSMYSSKGLHSLVSISIDLICFSKLVNNIVILVQ